VSSICLFGANYVDDLAVVENLKGCKYNIFYISKALKISAKFIGKSIAIL
jgi:hypothetical protein